MFGKLIKRMDEHSTFMGRMMDRLGVDRGKLALAGSGHDLARAARRCMACAADEDCKGYLDDPTATDKPPFCPNADLFKAHAKASAKV